ncbi:hypothetical protein D3C78_637590 [compost metagenome]
MGELELHAHGADQHRPAWPMKGAQPGITPAQGNHRPARMHELGKAGVHGGRKRQPMALQPAPRRPAERTFGGQMHGIRSELADLVDHSPEIPDQENLRIARTGHGAEVQRRQDTHLMPERLQFVGQRTQAGGYPAHPRLPGIADDQQPHRCDPPAPSAGAADADASRGQISHGLLVDGQSWAQSICHLRLGLSELYGRHTVSRPRNANDAKPRYRSIAQSRTAAGRRRKPRRVPPLSCCAGGRCGRGRGPGRCGRAPAA